MVAIKAAAKRDKHKEINAKDDNVEKQFSTMKLGKQASI